MVKLNTSSLNSLNLNSALINGTGEVQRGAASGGGDIVPLPPSVPEEPEPTPTYILSASVENGVVTASVNGASVPLPYEANEGDVIVVSVEPNDGYTFEGWADGNTDNPRTIVMSADVALSAECVAVVAPSKYIQFEDKNVEAICVTNWSSDGIGMTMEDAAAVTSIGTTFKGNTEITSFDELEYFTGLTFLGTSTNQTSGGAFNGCSALQSVKIPSSVVYLRPGAFYNCTSLKSVGDLSKVKQIGIYAFAGTLLEGEINLASVEGEIGYKSFTKTNITKILSLGNATIIGGSTRSDTGAFGECGLLQYVDLPSTTAEIRSWAFYKCTALQTFICRATTPPTLENANAFTNTNNCPIYVPDASLEAYKTATNWNTYADRIKPLSEIEGGHITTFEGLIGAYTFEGRSNEDADRDIVEDKSGYNNTLTLKSMLWGFIDGSNPNFVREGFWDDALWLSRNGYGEIALPKGLTDFTIIAKRAVFGVNAGSNWCPLVGTGRSRGTGLFWLEYNADDGRGYTNQVNGLMYALTSLESEVSWMTNTYYNGHRLTGTQGNDVHDGMVYINGFRGDVTGGKYQKIYAVYLFNRQLAPSEIEAFIKEKIDASYVLPTIEE